MITKDEFESLYQEALERVVERGMDVNDLTNVFDEIVNIKRELKKNKELIENQGKKQSEKQAGKLTGKHARRRAKKRAREWAIWDE